MTPNLLLDTCALIWIANGDPLEPDAMALLDDIWGRAGVISVSPISAWEIGLLVSRGRLALTMPPTRWWELAVERLSLTLAPMPPPLLIASTQLPGSPPNDPADRIIAATARDHGVRLMTRDQLLLGYGAEGHLDTVIC